jgi:sarcosine oxidase gamma subunit
VTDEEAASSGSTSDTLAEPVEATPKPVLRVVKGDLTAEELAALVAVIAARNAAAAHAAARASKRPRSEWGHPSRLVRQPHHFGPDQWRRSAWG